MDPFIFFMVLSSIYLVLLFFDLFFKSCMHYPYDAFLHNTGLNIKFLRLHWYTNAFNRTIFRLGSTSWSKFLQQSFTLGVIVTLILIPIGISLLLMTLFHSSNTDTDGHSAATKISQTNIEILLPGINLPLEEIGYYISTLIVCTIVHELGHAMAAVLEDIPINSFGFHIYFCIPIAFTEINQEHLLGLKCFKKLRILCGGIWHNIILAIFCYLIYSTFGFLANPFYHFNDAIIITEINNKSPLLGDKGLHNNDIITHINDCRTYDMNTWYNCLLKSIRNRSGYCVSSDFIRLNDESHRVSHGIDGLIQCCDPTNYKQCCFELIDDLNNINPIEIPQHVCLDIRKTIEDSIGVCTINCHEDDGFCIKPLLPNTTTILKLKRRNNDDVIYIGHPSDITKTIKVSSFIPKTNLFSPKFGDIISLFLKYLIVFSFGLAIINAIPCFGLDGFHIMSTIINNLLVNKITERSKREIIVILITSLGTFIFLCSVLKVLWISTFKDYF